MLTSGARYTVDQLGSAAFKPVTSDLSNNIAVRWLAYAFACCCSTREQCSRRLGLAFPLAYLQKIRTREMAAIDKCKTLEDLVQNEGADDKKRTATQALLWLTRCDLVSPSLSFLKARHPS